MLAGCLGLQRERGGRLLELTRRQFPRAHWDDAQLGKENTLRLRPVAARLADPATRLATLDTLSPAPSAPASNFNVWFAGTKYTLPSSTLVAPFVVASPLMPRTI